MPVSYHRTVCFISILLLAACESDETKFQRLRGEQGTQCLLVQKYREDLDAARKSPQNPYRDTLLQQWGEANTKCELATRDLNRFMR